MQSIDNKRCQTLRFEEIVYQRSLNSTRKAVAKEMWLNASTVKTIFKRWAKGIVEKQHHKKVRVLGIDEISLKKTPQTVCVSDFRPETLLRNRCFA